MGKLAARVRIVASGALLAALLLVPGQIVHADVNEFTINRFDADYTLTKDDPQGKLRVIERIEVTYTDNNHGILRAIPDRYKKHRLQLHVNKITSDTSAPTQFTTYSSNGNTVLKIGDPDRTVTGRQQYVIDYTLNNVISFYDGHDELYWDINGDEWQQIAQAVSLTLHLPSGLTLSADKPRCFAGGGYGSVLGECDIDYRQQDQLITARTTQQLAARQTLSVVVGFEKGYFKPSTWRDTLGEYTASILAFAAPLVLIGGGAGVLWFRRGRDARGRGVIVPQYDAPEGLGPLEAGTLMDFKADNRDITATIIDLAIRRYITIIEEKKVRRLRKDLTLYRLRLEKTDLSGLNEFEQALLKGLFSEFTAGQEVDLTSLKFKLADIALKLRKDVTIKLQKDDYLRVGPRFLATLGKVGLLLVMVIVTAGVAAVFNATGPFVFGAICGTVAAGVFLALLPSRSVKGVAAKEHLLGLKMYLKTAESERIKKMQSPNAPYAVHGHEPKRTVHLFEKLLPYAMVLGVEQEWAKQFEHIYRTPPDWYSGNWTAFNAGYLASSINSGVGAAVNTAFSSPSSSSGSGFSGGGSGGGGGGGGGGGW
jgi:uncharacterized membrane protein